VAQFLVAGRNPPELFQLVEETLHLLPSLVRLGVIDDGLFASALGRDDRQELPALEVLANRIAVIPFVHHRIGQLRQRRQLGKDGLKDRRIMAGATGQLQGSTGLLVETTGVNCGGASTPRAAQSLCRLPTVFFRAPAAC
jgi:hypothetical protein